MTNDRETRAAPELVLDQPDGPITLEGQYHGVDGAGLPHWLSTLPDGMLFPIPFDLEAAAYEPGPFRVTVQSARGTCTVTMTFTDPNPIAGNVDRRE